jgi:hypothetical protein
MTSSIICWYSSSGRGRRRSTRFAVIFSGPSVTADENDDYENLTGEGVTPPALSDEEIDARVLADGPAAPTRSHGSGRSTSPSSGSTAASTSTSRPGSRSAASSRSRPNRDAGSRSRASRAPTTRSSRRRPA